MEHELRFLFAFYSGMGAPLFERRPPIVENTVNHKPQGLSALDDSQMSKIEIKILNGGLSSTIHLRDEKNRTHVFYVVAFKYSV